MSCRKCHIIESYGFDIIYTDYACTYSCGKYICLCMDAYTVHYTLTSKMYIVALNHVQILLCCILYLLVHVAQSFVYHCSTIIIIGPL